MADRECISSKSRTESAREENKGNIVQPLADGSISEAPKSETNQTKSSVSVRNKSKWANLTSRAVNLEKSQNALLKALEKKQDERSERSTNLYPNEESSTNDNLRKFRTTTRRVLSKSSSLMWQQAVQQVAKSHGSEQVEISAGADTIRSFNRQILKNKTTSFNVAVRNDVSSESVKSNIISPESFLSGDVEANIHNIDEDVLPKKFKKSYTISRWCHNLTHVPKFISRTTGRTIQSLLSTRETMVSTSIVDSPVDE